MQSKKYYSIEPARFKLDGGAMYGIIPKPLWHKVNPADEMNRIELALRLVLIETPTRKILIDTGIGDYHGEKFDSRFGVVGSTSPLEKALASINLVPDDITDLVISHLHFDHVGGIGKIVNSKMEPVLKKAMLHLHKSHYEYSHAPTERDAGSFHVDFFEPVIKWYEEHSQIHWVEGMDGVVLPGLNFKCSMGHTPFLLHAYDDKFIYMADLIPTSNHVNIPWVMGYDIAPGRTTIDKKEFLEFITKENLTMIFEHDPLYYGCKVATKENNYSCGEKFPFNEALAYPIL
jgi:glyoxylase-like metal-dependent hydrolase (beta-lactamase superfamily II)